ncbi:CoA ester lyase [uncultured Rhodoblastus sp.]|uniref:HpcH/HpaI aldolase/citrate lyase family protein n=1 Tax=uncultured Rhodoblastus sp. TaxID=543037 RepID=UPI0025F139B5|nr:CoA ester lyase [uncultured Rhodoblastus sp.]
MSSELSTLALFLFVPADRPDRWEKAYAAGADAVILDLEDAVAAAAKDGARWALREGRDTIAAAPCPSLVRINARTSEHYGHDLEVVRHLGLAGVILAKAETGADIEATEAAAGAPVVALVESAKGLAEARQIAAASARIAFGSIDYAADIGSAHTRAALASARAELVLASRLAHRPAPIDGVTTNIKDPNLVRADAEYACELGFSGKLLIHPAQIAPAMDGFRPSDVDIAWAERILAARGAAGAVAIDGAMVDAPVFLRAEQILRRATRFRAPAA